MKEHKSTPEEIQTDRELNKQFVAEFEKRFGKNLSGLVASEKDSLLCDMISTYLRCESGLKETDRVKNIRKAFIAVKNGIWPCGIREVDGKKIFGRTFTISYEVKADTKPKFQRNFEERTIKKFYSTKENMNEVLDEFEAYALYNICFALPLYNI